MLFPGHLAQIRNQLPIVLGGKLGRSGQLQKISCQPGFNPQTVQHVVSHCPSAGSRVHWKRRENRERKVKGNILHRLGSKFAIQIKLPHTYTHIFILALDGCLCSMPLNPRREIRFPLFWLGPGLVWTAAECLVQDGIQSPDSPACSKSLCQLRYPNPHIAWHAREIIACTQAEWNKIFCSSFINDSVKA